MPGGHNLRRSNKMLFLGGGGIENPVMWKQSQGACYFSLKAAVLFKRGFLSKCSTVYGAYLVRRKRAAILQKLRPFFILYFTPAVGSNSTSSNPDWLGRLPFSFSFICYVVSLPLILKRSYQTYFLAILLLMCLKFQKEQIHIWL